MNLFSGRTEWIPDKEDAIAKLKLYLNLGKYDILEKIEDLEILLDLLIDFMEDSVICCINQEKIKAIFKFSYFTTNFNIFFNVNNIKNTQDLRKELYEFVKFNLDIYENEILITICQFISIVFPEKHSFIELELILERFSIVLLGNNSIDYYDKQRNHGIRTEKEDTVEKLTKLLYLFIFVIKSDLITKQDEDLFYSNSIVHELDNDRSFKNSISVK